MKHPGYVIFVPHDDRQHATIRSHIAYYNHTDSRRIDNWDIDTWVPVIPDKADGVAIWHWPGAKEYFPLNLRATLAAYYGGITSARLYGDCIITARDNHSLTLNAANIALKVLEQCHSLAGSLLLSARSKSISDGYIDPIAEFISADKDSRRYASGNSKGFNVKDKGGYV